MRLQQYYPLLQVKDVAETAAFYMKHFGFKALFESDWYVHLQSETDEAANLAVLQHDHETIPQTHRGTTKGMILTLEVEDVDAEHKRLSGAGVTIVQGLRDEPHGQRHAVYCDPNDILIDVITPIAPSEEFLADYTPSALPQ